MHGAHAAQGARRKRTGARSALAAALLAIAMSPGGAAAEPPGSEGKFPPVSAAPPSDEPIWLEAPRAGPTEAERPDLAPLIGRVEGSVVRLSAGRATPDGRLDSGQRAYATGFVLSAEGYILTADALITGARNLRAGFDDGRELPVEVIGRDPNTEVALLRVSPEQAFEAGIRLVPAPLGDSAGVRPGDGVLTLGHGDPEGCSAAQGTVAGRDLRIAPLDSSGARYLRLDMLLVPGFGGAPLLDMSGRVIGIISAERLSGSDLDSISFAVPIETAKRVLPDLLRSKREPSGWLGVQIQPIDPKLAAGLGLDIGGALVTRVIQDSPAQRAEIRQGDVILEFDGRPIIAYRDLTTQVAGTRPGSEVALVVLRSGARMQLRATIERRDAAAVNGATDEDDETPGFGLECAELTPELALRYSLPVESRGIVIVEIAVGGPAQLAGLQLGDTVLEIDGQRVESLDATIERLRGADPRVLLIRRGATTKYVALTR